MILLAWICLWDLNLHILTYVCFAIPDVTQKKFVSTEGYCWDAAIHLFWCGWVGTIPIPYYPRAIETKISCKSRKDEDETRFPQNLGFTSINLS